MQWSKEFPRADGDYYSRIDEHDKQPTPIRIENGAVYEFGESGSLRREYEVEDYEYLGPITPEQAEQFDALRRAADDALTYLESVAWGDCKTNCKCARCALRRALGKEQ